jgi:hypothetical protein
MVVVRQGSTTVRVKVEVYDKVLMLPVIVIV